MATAPPTTITAGDNASWDEASTVADERWEYVLTSADGHKLTVTGTYAANNHSFAITTAQSGSLVPGRYDVQRLVYADGTRTTSRKTNTLHVYPNPATDREPSHNAKMVAAIRESLEGGAPEFLEAHSVNGISITKMSVDDKERLLARYEARLARERDRERVARGAPSRREIQIEFT